MHRTRDLNIGEKFSEWTVTARVEAKFGKLSSWQYECTCSCGTVAILEKSHLLNGRTRHCNGHKKR